MGQEQALIVFCFIAHAWYIFSLDNPDLLQTTEGDMPPLEGSLVGSSRSFQRWQDVDLMPNLETYIKHETLRLKIIKKNNFSSTEDNNATLLEERIAKLMDLHSACKRNSSTAKLLHEDHPTTIFVYVRNFLANWNTMIQNKTVSGKRFADFMKVNLTSPLPEKNDLDIVANGIGIIQATYNISLEEMLDGNILGHYGEKLTAPDCYDIGKTLAESGLSGQAFDWLSTAVNRSSINKVEDVQDLTFNLSNALHHLARISYQREDKESSVRLMEKAVEMEPENLALHQDYVRHRSGRNVSSPNMMNTDSIDPLRSRFFHMCRETVRNKISDEESIKPQTSSRANRRLRCRLRRTSQQQLPYNVNREEILSLSPYISVIYNFLGESQTQAIKEITLDKLQSSTSNGQNVFTSWQSKNNNFEDGVSEGIAQLSARINSLHHFDATQSITASQESVNIIDYGMSGLTLPHSEHERFVSIADQIKDGYKMNKSGVFEGRNSMENSSTVFGENGLLPNFIKKYMQGYKGSQRGENDMRWATIQLFLAEPKAGGATVFLNQNITVKPEKGKALLWYNFKPNGEPELDLLVATCPLAVGQNIVLERGLWKRPIDRSLVCAQSRAANHLKIERILQPNKDRKGNKGRIHDLPDGVKK